MIKIYLAKFNGKVKKVFLHKEEALKFIDNENIKIRTTSYKNIKNMLNNYTKDYLYRYEKYIFD